MMIRRLALGALAGLVIGAGIGFGAHLLLSSRGLSVASACQSLALSRSGHVSFPSASALSHVADQMGSSASDRAFRVALLKSAADESSQSLAHVLKLGPDFAAVLNWCNPALPAAASRQVVG